MNAETKLLNDIAAELANAREKFPGKNVTFAALIEEVGETATALFEEPRINLRKEAIQVAVMAMRLILDGDHTLDAWREAKGLDPILEPTETTQQHKERPPMPTAESLGELLRKAGKEIADALSRGLTPLAPAPHTTRDDGVWVQRGTPHHAHAPCGLENIAPRKQRAKAPRQVTQDMVTHETVREDYHHFPGSLHTVCALTLKNGFTVTGESACIDPISFDADLGRTLAKGKARQKVFEHLAFRARDELSREMRARQIVEEISTDFEQSALRRAQASLR